MVAFYSDIMNSTGFLVADYEFIYLFAYLFIGFFTNRTILQKIQIYNE